MEVYGKGNSYEGNVMRSMGIVVKGTRYSSVGRACRCNKVSIADFDEWFRRRVGYSYSSCVDNELLSNLLESYITANEVKEEKLTVFGIEYDSLEDFKAYWNFDNDDYSDYCKTHNIEDAGKKESLIDFIKAGRPRQTLSYGGNYFACVEDMCDFYRVEYQDFFSMLRANYTCSDIVKEFNKYVNIQNISCRKDEKSSVKNLENSSVAQEVHNKGVVEDSENSSKGVGGAEREYEGKEVLSVAEVSTMKDTGVKTQPNPYEEGLSDVLDTTDSVAVQEEQDGSCKESEGVLGEVNDGTDAVNIHMVVDESAEELSTPDEKEEETVESSAETDSSTIKDTKAIEPVPDTVARVETDKKEKVAEIEKKVYTPVEQKVPEKVNQPYKKVNPVSPAPSKSMSMSEYLQRRKSGFTGVVKSYENTEDAVKAAQGRKDKGVKTEGKGSDESKDPDPVGTNELVTGTEEDVKATPVEVKNDVVNDTVVVGKPSKSMEQRSKGLSEGDFIEVVEVEDESEKATEELIKKNTVSITVTADTLEEACRSIGSTEYDFKKFCKDIYGLNFKKMSSMDLTTYFKYFVNYKNCNGGHPVVYNGKYYDSVDTLCAENEYEIGAFSSYFNLNVQGVKFDKCYDVEVMSRAYSRFVEAERKKECTAFGKRFKSLRSACSAYGFGDTVFYIRAYQIFKDKGSAEEAIRGLSKYRGTGISYGGKSYINVSELCSAFNEDKEGFKGYVRETHGVNVDYLSYEMIATMFEEYINTHKVVDEGDLGNDHRVFKFGDRKFTNVKSLCEYFGTTVSVFRNWLKYSGNEGKFKVGYYNVVVRKFYMYLDGRKPKYGVTYPYCGAYFKSVYDLCSAYGVDVDDFTVWATVEKSGVLDYLNALEVASSFNKYIDKYAQERGIRRRDSYEEGIVASDVCYVEYGAVVYNSLAMACDARKIDIDTFRKWCLETYDVDPVTCKDYKKLSTLFMAYM